MRIIDLLNNISKGQKVPEIINYKQNIYNYSFIDNDYFRYNDGNKIFLFENLFKDYATDNFINDYVIIKQNNYEFEKDEIIDIKSLIEKVYNLSLKVKELENNVKEL